MEISAKKKFLIFARELISRYFRHNVGRAAAAQAYYFIFTFFPLVVFMSAILAKPEIQELVAAPELARVIPDDVFDIINFFAAQSSGKANSLAAFGGFFSLYFPIRAVNSLFISINAAYGMRKHRNAAAKYFSIVTFTVALLAGIIVSLITMVVGKSLLTFFADFTGINLRFINVWNILRFFILAAAMFLVLSLLYYLAPSEKNRNIYIFPGTAAALFSWLVISSGFAFYAENMKDYSVFYGSVGAVIVLILWLYLTSVVLIMGAEFNQALKVTQGYIIRR